MAFMDEQVLLRSEFARELYHDCAAKRPIIDYHCHIDPTGIADNKRFRTITEAWLGGDHYKWRLMRANGVSERLVTGEGEDRDKFRAFAACLERAPGNPVYAWAHLELRRYFGYDGILTAAAADEAFDHCNARLDGLRVRDILRLSRVETICTTDDPADDLAAHSRIREDASCSTRVLPGWRPDRAVNIRKPEFRAYIDRLSAVSGTPIRDMDSLFAALTRRLDYFDAAGCRVSDHGLDLVPYAPGWNAEAAGALADALEGRAVTEQAAEAYQFMLLQFLGGEYARRGWAMQLHYGALRNINSRLFQRLGPDTGGDAVGSAVNPEKIAGFLDALDRRDALPKTVLYSLNPNDNGILTSIMGAFQRDVPGKLQHGCAWWFNDTRTGMKAQLANLAEQGLLGNFIGMLTDSRCFLSYTRHEYFRRVLCDWIGEQAERGELPSDRPALEPLVRGICCDNVRAYLGL